MTRDICHSLGLKMNLFLQFLERKARLPVKSAKHITKKHGGKIKYASIFLRDIIWTLQEAAAKTKARVIDTEQKLICDVYMENVVGHRNHLICKSVRFVICKNENIIITAYPI